VYHGFCVCTAVMADGGGWHGRAGFTLHLHRKACDGSPEEMTPKNFGMGDDDATAECNSCPQVSSAAHLSHI